MKTIEILTRQGEEVFEEAIALLSGLSFSADHGVLKEGRHLAVVVDPRRNEDGHSMWVLIQCIPFGHRLVDWRGLSISAEAKHHAGQPRHLDTRGKTVIQDLPPDEYKISVNTYTGSSNFVRIENSRIGRESLAAATDRLDREEPRATFLDHGKVKGVVYTIKQTAQGMLEIAFEAGEDMKDHRIAFSLADSATGAEIYAAEWALQPARTQGVWEASGNLGPASQHPEPWTMIFNVLPLKARD